MKELQFPLLQPYQIEVRVGQVSENGFTLLLYKTSRTDAEILDNVVGIGNWQKRFYTLEGVGIGDKVRSIVVCSVGIYDSDKKEWVWKDDSGTEGNIEQDKSICSDAFKRASGGSCWGIGRELYYTGFIFVKGGTKKKDFGSGYELVDKYARFDVETIEWETKPTLKLKTLVILDKNNKVVYSYGSKTRVVEKTEDFGELEQRNIPSKGIQDTNNVKGSISSDQSGIINAFLNTLSDDKREKWFAYIDKNFGTMAIEMLTFNQAQALVDKINKGVK